jgi:sugar phosphate isomerase/epimerase
MSDPLLEQFAACTDEVHPDLETALRAIREMGLRRVELLEFWGKPVVAMEAAEIDRAKRLLDEYGMSVVAIGSLFLKPTLLGEVRRGEVARDAAFRAEMETLRAEIRVAQAVGAPIVRTFAFRRDGMVGLGNPSPRLPRGGEIPDETLAKIVEGLRVAAEETAAAGLTLGLENVRSCWANTGHTSARIIRAVDHPALKAIWDPGNDFVSGGRPYPDGYEAVRPFICHVHVKDARVVDAASGLTAWEAVGAGEVDYIGQFAALRRDGYAGTLSLETHWHPPTPGGGAPDPVEDSRVSFAGVRRALADSLAASGA